jgi:hypothetical protein
MKALKKKRSTKPIAKKKKAATKAKVAKSKTKKSSAAKKKPSVKRGKPPIGICAFMESSEGQAVQGAFVMVALPVTSSVYQPIEKLFGLDWKKSFADARAYELQKPNARLSVLDYWAPLFIMGVGYEDRKTITHMYALKWGDAVFVFGGGLWFDRKRVSLSFATIVGKEGEAEEEAKEESEEEGDDDEPVENVSLTLGVEAVRAIESAIKQWDTIFEHKTDGEWGELNLKEERSVALKTFEKYDDDNYHVWTKNWEDDEDDFRLPTDCLNSIANYWSLCFIDPQYVFD